MKKNILKKFIVLFSLGLILIGWNIVFSEELLPPTPVSVHLRVVSGSTSFFDADIAVSACDSDNDSETPDVITPYCALLQSGLDIDWNWSWTPGVYVNSIGDVAGYTNQDSGGTDIYHYWSWSLNGNYAEVGLNYYDESNELKANDLISLDFLPIEEEAEEVVPLAHHSGGGSSVVGSSVTNIVSKKVFSIPSALEFLSKNEKENGSFGSSLYTDWVAIGIAKAEDESEVLKNTLVEYLKGDELKSEIVTDNERRAMALMSLGINPYSGTKVNYIKKITDSFDGTQIGDKSLYNDDIFALIVLSHTGYTDKDEMIDKIVTYVIGNQSPDGSWGSVDMTSASIQALSNFKNLSGANESIVKAGQYLKNNQKEDGSFENLSSTSWAIQAMSLDDSLQSEVDKAVEYIADKQLDDGGLDQEGMENRIWSTSYAIPAVLKLSWNGILESFPKEVVSIPSINEIKTTPAKNVNENKIIKNKILPKFTEKEIVKDSLLSASAGDAVINTESADSQSKHTFWQKVGVPFKWLFIKLGF